MQASATPFVILGQAETAVTARLQAEFNETFRYVASAPEQEALVSGGEPVLQPEPVVITRSLETDILAEVRRAAEERKAREFVLLKGEPSILSSGAILVSGS